MNRRSQTAHVATVVEAAVISTTLVVTTLVTRVAAVALV